MKPLCLALLLALLAACASEDNGTPAPALSDTGLDTPPTDATEGEPAKFDPATLAGKTYLIEINRETAKDTCASPPTNPLICAQSPGLMGDSTLRIAVQFEISDEGQLTVYAGGLDDQLHLDGKVRASSSLDFDEDARAYILFKGLDINSPWGPLAPLKLTIEATPSRDLSGLNIPLLQFNFYLHCDYCDPDPCTMGLCEPDGTLLLELHNLTARLAPEIDLMRCATPVSQVELTGKKWRLGISPSELARHCEIPPTDPLSCYPAYTIDGFSDEATLLEFEVLSTRGNALDLQLRMGYETAQPRGSTVLLPPVDFTDNPCFEADMFDFDWPVTPGLNPRIREFHMEAAFAPDLSALHIARWRLVYDAARLSELVGIDVCNLTPCQPDGTILIQLKDLEARRVVLD